MDDERPILRFLTRRCSGQYEIVQAATGEDAIRSVATERPDLVILDLGLPDIDGVEVTRQPAGVDANADHHCFGARTGRR